MIRPQPIRRRPRLRARIIAWLTGHPARTHHQTWRY